MTLPYDISRCAGGRDFHGALCPQCRVCARQTHNKPPDCSRFAMHDTETTDDTALLRQALDDLRIKYSDLIYEGVNRKKAEEFECDIAALRERLGGQQSKVKPKT